MHTRTKSSPTLVETLESRQLLHANFSAAVNFQPLSAPRAPGMLIDYGSTYDVRRGGLMYGWNTELSANTVDRNLTSVQRNDTFIVLPAGAKWEIAVPDGRYSVYLVAGDPGAINERMAINVEGQTALAGITRKTHQYLEGAIEVDVTDGRISVEGYPGLNGNKLCYLGISSVEEETPKTLSIAATFAGASETGPVRGWLTLTRGGNLHEALSVPLNVSGTASNGIDYGIIKTPVTFAAGEDTIELPINPVNDQQAEGTESVVVTLGAVSGYTITQPAATVNITDAASAVSSWSKGASAPLNVGEVAGGIIGTTMYMVGGASQSTFAYDLTKNTWKTLAKRPLWGDHYGAEVYNGKLYLIGGLGASGGKVQIYNPATNSWSQGAGMPISVGSVSTSLINGLIYAVGGVIGTSASNYTGTGTTNRSFVYNPSTNKWSEIAKMPVGRNHAAAATDGSKLYVFGGRDGANKTTNGFNDVQIYNPKTNTWTWNKTPGSGIPALPQARGGMGKAVFANGEFYVIGGETQSGAGATSNRVYQRVDIYNPVTRAWRAGPKMPTARHGIFPLLYKNKIYVAMGGNKAEGGDTNVLEILNLG